MTIIVLLAIVGLYSTMGGIRGVILTDIVQLAMALLGSFWFAYKGWQTVGGKNEILSKLDQLYGTAHTYLDFFPSVQHGWMSAITTSFFVLGMYLFVQSFANLPADGGGYLMQRLNTTKNERHAQWASILFLILQYIVRVWPWMVIGIVALILIPIGQETTALHGLGAMVSTDREMAYPVLMIYLLNPGILGIMVTSLLAAFMSTIDTHINWGASYIVNDIFLRIAPRLSNRAQIRVARLSVSGFVILGVLISFQIDTIEQAWKWIATIGASLGIPTMLRWVWWRVTAWAEIISILLGLCTAIILATLTTTLPYELEITVIAAASVIGLFIGMLVRPTTPLERIHAFIQLARPIGIWPDRSLRKGVMEIIGVLVKWVSIVAAGIAAMRIVHLVVFR